MCAFAADGICGEKHMKRVLCLISGMNAGGAETFLMKVYRRLDKTKYQMDFCINVAEKCFYEDEITSLGGRIYRIPPKSESVGNFRRQLFDVVKSNRYMYVLRITSNAFGFMDLKIAHKAGATVCAARSSNSSDGGSVKSRIVHMLGRLLYGRYVNVMIAPSDLAAEYTFGKRAYKSGSVKILHNAIDTDVYGFDAQGRKNIRAELKISENTTVIGHVGRFTAQKNHLFLIDVFSEYVKQSEDSVLVLVGNGELEGEIRNRAAERGVSDRIVFTGVRSDVPALFSAMDVFVFPSFYEGMPNAVIEAQATGLPCVISDRITREADITGLVDYLPLGDAAAWAEHIRSMSLPVVRKTPCREFTENCYDIESVTKQFVRLVFQK